MWSIVLIVFLSVYERTPNILSISSLLLASSLVGYKLAKGGFARDIHGLGCHFYNIVCSLFGSSELHREEGWVMTGQSSIIFQYTKAVIRWHKDVNINKT